MASDVDYAAIVAALEPTGMVARGGFVVGPDDDTLTLDDGRSVRTIVVIGNIGGAMWP